MSEHSSAVESVYRERAARFAEEAAREERRSGLLSYARIAAFAAALGLLVWAEAADYRSGLVAAGVAFLLLFLGLVVYHGRVRERLRRVEALRRINEDGVRRLHRDWATLPGLEGAAPPGHAYALDLDIVGPASLFRLIGANSTPIGRATLLNWLLAPAGAGEARARQRAVAELAPMIDLRDELGAGARLMGRTRAGASERFLGWAEDRPWLRPQRALVWATRLVPALTLTLIALRVADVIPVHAWILPLIFHFWAAFHYADAVGGQFQRAFPGADVFEHYAALFRLLSGSRFEAPRLRAVQAGLTTDGADAALQLRRLGRLMDLAELRQSMFHFPINILTLWDFHVLYALEGWQERVGREVRRWFAALGDAEALAALAALAHDHPDWSFPEVEAMAAPKLEAKGLGHPLIPPAARVDNDVEIGPPGSFLLVTGSNMSGKSTLLRAVGVNAVLAQAGGPVCADALRLPPVAVLTNMRVADSLEKGVSYFMAELRRLKEVIDAADALEGDPERTALYLLDEILGGTNTAERQVAVRRVIRHLLDVGAIGAVTTHDLALAEIEDLAGAAHAVHFHESLGTGPEGRSTMSFDYTLRPGVATSVNALKLMELMGLGLRTEG